MCLAIPGKIIEIRDDDGTPMATVDFGGIRKEVCLVHLAEPELDEYVIVHVGFAICRLDEESALATLALFREIERT